ncbi:unnamed protein product [Trichobilharzia regenti]|nr:unnamed protein product [Trichobilharzia regenti]
MNNKVSRVCTQTMPFTDSPGISLSNLIGQTCRHSLPPDCSVSSNSAKETSSNIEPEHYPHQYNSNNNCSNNNNNLMNNCSRQTRQIITSLGDCHDPLAGYDWSPITTRLSHQGSSVSNSERTPVFTNISPSVQKPFISFNEASPTSPSFCVVTNLVANNSLSPTMCNNILNSPGSSYIGEMDRLEAVNLLNNCVDGTFLVRLSKSAERMGEYSLSVVFGHPRHIRIQRFISPDNSSITYGLCELEQFPSIPVCC